VGSGRRPGRDEGEGMVVPHEKKDEHQLTQFVKDVIRRARTSVASGPIGSPRVPTPMIPWFPRCEYSMRRSLSWAWHPRRSRHPDLDPAPSPSRLAQPAQAHMDPAEPVGPRAPATADNVFQGISAVAALKKMYRAHRPSGSPVPRGIITVATLKLDRLNTPAPRPGLPGCRGSDN
jgi:hypothetical protein